MLRPHLLVGLRASLALTLALGCRAADTSSSDLPTPSGAVSVIGAGGSVTDAGMGEDAGPMDAGPPPVEAAVTITSPSDGATFVQDDVVSGEWAAEVTFAVAASGVTRVELYADGTFLLGETDAAGSLTYAFFGTGERLISAVGLDARGAERARDEITIRVDPPADTGCHAMLDGLGLDWAVTGASPGIADPVRVQPVINGVRFRYVSNSEPTAMNMDCELAVRLHQLTEVLVPLGIDEVIHIGIYNYRCIGGGDPDSGSCTPSQHAYARAIDLHAFGLAGSATEYSTETDWVITERADPCPISSTTEADRVLKEIACAMWSQRIFQIVLTPNYNAAHRNHFHVDLTAGSMYLGQSVAGLDPAVEGLGH